MAKIRRKDSTVILDTRHSKPEVARINYVVGEEWPTKPDGTKYDAIVTRGAEEAPGGKKDSRHMKYQAKDYRTWHLPESIDRQKLLDKIMARLGSEYYGYYGKREEKNGTITRWFHIQWNGGKK